jgi:hypothetical protein
VYRPIPVPLNGLPEALAFLNNAAQFGAVLQMEILFRAVLLKGNGMYTGMEVFVLFLCN